MRSKTKGYILIASLYVDLHFMGWDFQGQSEMR